MISIRIKNLKEIQIALAKFPRYMKAVQHEFSRAASEVVLADQGGNKPFYAPETSHNRPPEIYYERGVGSHYVNRIEHTSEQMDKRFYTKTSGFNTHIGNTASYAHYVIGDDQTYNSRTDHHGYPIGMAQIGWQKLINAARKGKQAIADRWDDIVRRTLERVGLKVK
jgi:hypothetical protein